MTTWDAFQLGTGMLALVSGGAFLAWSTFTSAGLARAEPAAAVAVMRGVNVAAPRSVLFMAVLFLPGLAAAVVAVRAAGEADWGPVLASVVYVVGVIGMTVAFHVPRNDALDRAPDAEAVREWPRWLRTWVAGNHVRTLSGVVAGVLLVVDAAR